MLRVATKGQDEVAAGLSRIYRRRGLMLIAATYLMVGVFALRMLTESAEESVGLLFSLPIALFALALGLRGGVAAALVSLALIAVYDVTHDDTVSAVAYVTRAVAFITLGGLVGAVTTEFDALQEKLTANGRRRGRG